MPTIPSPSDTPGDLPPNAGLPDVQTLARLANEIFAALPGIAGPPTPDSAAAGTPAGPGASLPPGAPSVQGLPAPPSGIPSGSPYYFIGEASAYRPPAAFADGTLDRPEAIAAQSHALPGERDLRALIERMFAEPARVDTPVRAAPGDFYFADSALPSSSEVPGVPVAAHPSFDVHALRRDFPILSERVNGRPLIWLDNAATTQKPQAVIDRLAHFYAHENSNIHRAAHELAARATDAYEAARGKVARFLGASEAEEIIFVRGATEAINLVAQSWGRQNAGTGDEILITWLEHHANIVPWQQLAAATGAKLRVAPVDDSGQVLLDEYQKLLSHRTRLAAFAHVSNALGTITPVREMIDLAHRAGALALVDGAQSVAHQRVDVQALDADFFVFSGHKIFAPTGIGVLYGKRALLEAMPPWQGGGNMIEDVTFEHTRYRGAPVRFEAGTGNIADAVGLGAALDYLERIGMENIRRYEHDLLHYATRGLLSVPGLRLIGTAREKASVLSFVLDGHKPEEVGSALNREGIAVRAGHHCAQPILRRFGVEATVRPSLAFYNTCEEIDALVVALRRLQAAPRPAGR